MRPAGYESIVTVLRIPHLTLIDPRIPPSFRVTVTWPRYPTSSQGAEVCGPAPSQMKASGVTRLSSGKFLANSALNTSCWERNEFEGVLPKFGPKLCVLKNTEYLTFFFSIYKNEFLFVCLSVTSCQPANPVVVIWVSN